MKQNSRVAIFPLLTLVSVVSSAVIDKVDEIVDPEELNHLSTPPPNHFWDEWEDWDAWEPKRDMSEWFPYYRCGYDNDGSVVYVMESGKWNIRNLTLMPNDVVEEFWKYNEQFNRRAEIDAARTNNQGIVFILDWDEFSLANYATSACKTEFEKMTLQIFTSLFRFSRAMKYGFFINVNYPAETFLDLSRPFIGNGMENVELYGPQSRKWKPMLLKRIPRDQLPPKYGGDENWKPLPSLVTDSL